VFSYVGDDDWKLHIMSLTDKYTCKVWFHDGQVKGTATVIVMADNEFNAHNKAADAVKKQFVNCPVVVDKVTSTKSKKPLKKSLFVPKIQA
jgi:hypothetical protein